MPYNANYEWSTKFCLLGSNSSLFSNSKKKSKGQENKIQVFIVSSSDEKDKVLGLVKWFRKKGIDAKSIETNKIDYEECPSRYLKNQLDNSHNVLIVCSSKLKSIVDEKGGQTPSKGNFCVHRKALFLNEPPLFNISLFLKTPSFLNHPPLLNNLQFLNKFPLEYALILRKTPLLKNPPLLNKSQCLKKSHILEYAPILEKASPILEQAAILKHAPKSAHIIPLTRFQS